MNALEKNFGMLSAAVALAFATQAGASLLAYDGFAAGTAAPDYVIDEAIVGDDAGGTALTGRSPVLPGFLGTDKWHTVGLTNPNEQLVLRSGSLSYTDANSNVLVTSGHRSATDNAGNTAGTGLRRLDLTTGTGPFASYLYDHDNDLGTTPELIGKDGTTLYFSVLMQDDANRFTSIEFLGSPLSEVTSNPDAVRALAIGDMTGNVSGTPGLDTSYGLIYRTGSGTPTVVTTEPLSTGTVLVVGRIDFGGGTAGADALTVWINPVNLLTEAGNVADAAVTDGALNLSHFRINDSDSNSPFSVDGNEEIQVDELRIGSTWSSVLPVPEPASLSLLAASAAGLLARRRRA